MIRNLKVCRNAFVDGCLDVDGRIKTRDLEVKGVLTVRGDTNVHNLHVAGELEARIFLNPATVSAGHIVDVGDVLVVSPDADREVVASFAAEQTNVVGVAVSATSLFNQQVRMAVAGEFLVRVEGPINRGNFLETSATQGVARFSSGGRAFAIATSTDLSPGIKLVYARFLIADSF